MTVVINDFEILPAPAQGSSQGTPGAPASKPPADKPAPQDLTPLLLALQAEALRAWAH